MLEHSRYEELCALAGVGQISTEELKLLQEHLPGCDFCRNLQADFIGINSLYLAQVQKAEPDVYDPQSALRQKILRNLQAAGAEFSSEIKQEITAKPKKLGRYDFGSIVSRPPVWATAALLLVGILGYGIGTYTHPTTSTPNVAVVAPQPVVKQDTVKTTTPVNDSKLSAALLQQSQLEQRVAAAENDKSQLHAELKQVLQQIAALQEARSRDQLEIGRITASAQGDKDTALRAEAQLRSLREAQSSKDADLVAASYRVRELEGKLAEQDDAIARERQVLASGDSVKELIGARNLHIIDVADVGPGGQKRPFGRVFYTEGKSLIFYAYDLAGTKGQQTFYAWGQREGDPHSTKALGALKNDDQAQKRWVFTFSNAKVLSQIDSVYVTLEPNEKPGEKPRGKKLMNAYLGTAANHP